AVDQEEVQTLLKNNVSGPDRALADSDLLQQALTDGMAVRDLLDQAANVIKISKPLREGELSRADQNLVVSTANFPASRFKDQIPAITDSDIATQFDSFKDFLPGQFGSTGNPLGFGYKTPNRVQVQYIGIRGDDAKNAVKSSKSEQDWYIAAY